MGALARASDIPAFNKLHRIAHGLQQCAGSAGLSTEQMFALNTLILTIHKAKKMSPATARAHIKAVWTLQARTAVEKTALAPGFVATLREFLAGAV